MKWLARILRGRSAAGASETATTCVNCETLAERCRDLERRVHESEQRLRERGELLYEVQKHYSSEHFGFQESMRSLKIERMRNAGASGERDLLMRQANTLRRRIEELEKRLGRYEAVEP